MSHQCSRTYLFWPWSMFKLNQLMFYWIFYMIISPWRSVPAWTLVLVRRVTLGPNVTFVWQTNRLQKWAMIESFPNHSTKAKAVEFPHGSRATISHSFRQRYHQNFQGRPWTSLILSTKQSKWWNMVCFTQLHLNI